MKSINIKKLIKWLLFFGAFPFSYVYLAFFMIFPPFFIVYVICSILVEYFPIIDFDPLLVLFFILPISLSPLVMYVYAKIFGFFKFVDSLNMKFVLRVGVVVVASLVLFLISYASYFSDKSFLFEFNNIFSYCAFALIPAYFFYKFFQYLTKKFPHPFEKIGYYSSLPFWKGKIAFLRTKIKNKFVNK